MATLTIPKLLANFETSLAAKMSDSTTTLTLNTSVDDDGNTLSGLYELTIDEGTNSEEHMLVTLTGASGNVDRRGLSRVDFWTEKAGNKFEHSRGASVKITNFSLGILTRLLNGTDTFNSVDWTGVNSIRGLALPVNNDDAASKQYVDNTATGTTFVNRVIVGATAGEVVAAGELVYLDETDNEWKLADASASSTSDNVQLGVAQGAGTNGAAITNGVLLFGRDANQAGLTQGDRLYVSDTAGEVASAAGTVEVEIGHAVNATEMDFYPKFASYTTKAQRDALAGTSGTPGAANKYVTNDDTASAPAASKVARFKANSKLDDAGLALTTAGDIVYSDGTDLQRLAIGSAGQVLKTNSGATAPEWGGFAVDVQTADVSVDNTAVETDIVSFTLPGGTLSTGNAVLVRAYVSSMNATTTTFAIKGYYGGSSVSSGNLGGSAIGGGSDTAGGYIEFLLFATGATNTQEIFLIVDLWDNNVSDWSSARSQIRREATGTTAIDSTANQTMKLTFTWAGANAANRITIENAFAIPIQI